MWNYNIIIKLIKSYATSELISVLTDVKYAISSYPGTPLQEFISVLLLISEPRFYCDFEPPDQYLSIDTKIIDI